MRAAKWVKMTVTWLAYAAFVAGLLRLAVFMAELIARSSRCYS